MHCMYCVRIHNVRVHACWIQLVLRMHAGFIHTRLYIQYRNLRTSIIFKLFRTVNALLPHGRVETSTQPCDAQLCNTYMCT
jgi:hypothetical protein